MDRKTFENNLQLGENICIEFKRCDKGVIGEETYKTVCSFLNRFGGDLFLGVTDDGRVCGVPGKAAAGMMKNLIAAVTNPEMFSPTTYLVPEALAYHGQTVIHVHVPPSGQVHRFKKDFYDRVGDSDVKLTADAEIVGLYIRKQEIFTEKRVYPHVTLADLRTDLLPRVRKMAAGNAPRGEHPWGEMGDADLLRSANLYRRDPQTQKEGFTLAAILLLGRDDTIRDICPLYGTDALLRKVNRERYDDRLLAQTNLIESYGLLLGFGAKHLLDKFFLGKDARRLSLSAILTREIVSNTLMHREFTSSRPSRLVIEADRMFVENPCRATRSGTITLENLEPSPRNPDIAAFFRNIGLADQLGSGVRKLFEYSRLYSGQDPEFLEGDMFRITVPLDDAYSNEVTNEATNEVTNEVTNEARNLSEAEAKTIQAMKENPRVTKQTLARSLGLGKSKVDRVIASLKQKGLLSRVGPTKSGHWVVKG